MNNTDTPEAALPEPPHRAAVAILAERRDDAISKVESLLQEHRDLFADANRAQREIDAAQRAADELDAAIAALAPMEPAKSEDRAQALERQRIARVLSPGTRVLRDTPQA